MENNLDNTVEPFATSPFGDRFLFSVNRNSFTKMSAEQVYENFFGRDYFKEEHLYLIVGTDSGALVNYFQRKGVPEGTRVVFLELPEILERLAEVIDFDQLDPALTVQTMDSAGKKLKEFELINYIFANRSVILKALCTTDAFIPEYYELYLKIKADLEEAIFTTRANMGDRRFMFRQMDNLAENRLSTECLKNKFAGKTAVLLAVGPSLDDIIPWVRENRDSLVVMAVSRAARKLYQEGLVPHIIFTMDPSDLSFDVSRESLHFFKDTIFIYGKHSTPLLLSQWRGKALYLGDRVPWKSEINMPTFGIAGPTVTQSLLKSALEMGFSRILLGGVDLCFSRDGYAYSSKIAGREKGTLVGDIPGGVETNGGWRAGTFHPYMVGARITAQLAKVGKKQGCEVINLAAGAMKIAGISYLPPDQLELAPSEEPIGTFLSLCLPEDNREQRLAHYQTMEKELNRVRAMVWSIEKLSYAALKANQQMFDPTSSKPTGVYKRRMDRIEKTIQTKFEDLPRVLKAFGILRFLRIIQPGREIWSDERIEKTARLYYESFNKAAFEFRVLIDRAKARIKVRQMEEYVDSDFNDMADQWEKDRHFGRCLVWRDRNPEAWQRLNEADRGRFAQLAARFQCIMEHEEDLSAEKAAPKIQIKTLRAKVLVAFRQGTAEGLEVLMAGLEDREEAAAKALATLARGYRAELQKDPETAIACYQEIIEGAQPVLVEDALGRVAALASEQKDYATLKMAFECLAGISPVYAPQYADLLWLLEERQAALDVYAEYLGQVPGDIRALLQLGRYYLQLNAPEAARVALGYVLEQDPENQTAQILLDETDQTA